ncbi:MAG: restriction endonuclease subunit S, partial [Dolichospermum sp.]
MIKKKMIVDILDTISITHEFDKDKLIFLNTSDVLEGKILINNYMPINQLKGQAKKTIQNGDILFSEIRPKNKRYAYVDVDKPEDYIVSTKLMVLRNKTSDVLTKYIYYFLTYDGMLDYLQMRAENRICSFPQITFDILKPILVNIPSIIQQQKIIDVISNIDNKIELNNRINSELENLAKTIYDYWFVQFDFPDENGKPYKSCGGKMVYNQELKREIPAGWEVGTLSKLGDIAGGSTPSTKNPLNFCHNGTAWITPKDLSLNVGNKFISRGELDVTDAGIKEASLKIYPKGTILLSSR